MAGALFPGSYLAASLDGDLASLGIDRPEAHQVRQFTRAWQRAVSRCGPATSVRALYDDIAEPLVTSMGFRTMELSFAKGLGEALLRTPAQVPLALILLRWGASPRSAWRDACRIAKSFGAEWALILAPPFVTLARVSGASTRQSLDFSVSVAVEVGGAHPFWRLISARVFDAGPGTPVPALRTLLERAARYQGQVASDLHAGVGDALALLTPVMASGPGGRLPTGEARHQALTVIYRLMFLLFAESRDLVPVGHPIYGRSYALGRLASEAIDGATCGSWDTLAAMTRLARAGCRSPYLDVAPFGGRLFARAAAPALEARPSRGLRSRGAHTTTDEAASRALVALASRPGPSGREPLAYRDLGVEQLGAVYERLLDDLSQRDRAADQGSANDGGARLRKSTGTFYTPQPLAEFLVRRTLAPLVDGASPEAILALRIVDPSMGSGACLVAACHYLASAYERALIADDSASPEDFDDHARADIRRLVAERCLAGVDRNPMAVELARLSLWLTTLARGKPLGFLDHRLSVGDSLVGAWPDDLARLSTRRRLNAVGLPLFDIAGIEPALRQVAVPLGALVTRRDDTLADVRARAAAWQTLTAGSSPLDPWRKACALWCARWFWPADAPSSPAAPEVRALLATLLTGEDTLPRHAVAARMAGVARADDAQSFFHWPLAFPDIFYESPGVARHARGFDAVIGNPPWEMLRQDGEGRGRDTAKLVRYIRDSGQYPSCTTGHVNLYQAFVDRSLALVRPGGRVGLVLPWGLASDDGAAPLRRRLLETTDVDTIVGCDNARGLFPIHRGIRFLVLTTTTGSSSRDVRGRFGITSAAELERLPERDDPLAPAYPIRLDRQRLETIGGPLLRIPDARHVRDLALVETLSKRFPRLGEASGWNVTFGRELNATEARPYWSARGMPVLEGKHLSPFVANTEGCARIERIAADRLLPSHPFDRPRLAYRDVSGVSNVVSLIAAIVPAGCLTSHTLLCLRTPVSDDRQHFLSGLFNSYVLNVVVRMLMGGHVTTTVVESLPVVPWSGSIEDRWIANAARSLASPDADTPALEAELQARVALRCGLGAAEFDAVLERFPLVPERARRRAADRFRSLLPAGPRK
jgi:hypothetical protein